MVSGNYSFIDIAVLDPVRVRLAAGDSLVILDIELDRLIWANGPGALLFGHEDVETVMGSPSRLPPVARRQIAAAPGFPRMRRETAVTARLAGATGGRPTSLLASGITLPDGEPAILLAIPAAQLPARAPQEVARQAVSGFTHADSFAALIDEQGSVEAASEGFLELGIAPQTLRELVEEVRDEEDRLVKRLISASQSLAAGMARLTDDPARHLLLVIEAGPAEAEPAPAEPAEELSPADAGEPEPILEAPPSEARQEEDKIPTGPETVAEAVEAEAPEPVEADETTDSESALPLPEKATEGTERATATRNTKGTVRFVWRTDADGRFTTISEEFAGAIGLEAREVCGRTFREVAEHFGLDAGEQVAQLLERRDTWSGRTVLWPTAGTGLSVPVDLAALPIYDRVRNFEGFRGFGVARMGDAVAAPERAGKAAGAGEPTDESGRTLGRDQPPALSLAPVPGRRESDKVIRLAEHRATNDQVEQRTEEEAGLSAGERQAFRQIGERLRRESIAEPTPETGAAQTPSEEQSAAGDRTDDERQDAVPEKQSDQPETQPPAPETPVPMAVRLDDLQPAPELERRGHALSAIPASAADQTGALNSLLSGLPLPVLVHAGDTLHFANREFLKLTGHDSMDSIAAAGGIGALFIDGTVPGHAGGTLRMARPDGEHLDVSAHLQSIVWNGRKALLLTLRPVAPAETDATPDAEDELQGRLDELRAIVDTATDGVVLVDNDGRIRSISRPAEALFGLDSTDVEGQPFTKLFAMESQRAASDYLAGLADNGVASVLNDGREVIGREAQGRFIPLFMTMGRLPGNSGFCAVLRDITNWKRAEEELTKARAQAERASSQKTEFLARVSHEVRTPLNAIIGFSELMLDEKFGPVGSERYRDYLRDINRSGNHVLDLVNDLLDISKIEAGEQEMNYEAVSLNDALTESVAMMQPQANRERVIIRSSFASRLPDVVADLRSVRQIALNLLSNAVRHTPAGGQVIVSTVYEPGGDIVVRVRDTGIGMTLPEIEEALKPFKQINAIKRSRGEGTGLGLPLTKALVEANRARFKISSSPGQGTMVEVTFPSTRVLAD